VSIIKSDYAPEWSRTRILSYLDWAQRQMFCTDCAQHLYYNTSDETFFIPYLKTTENVLSYTIDDNALADSEGNDHPLTYFGRSVTCRRVNRVFHSVTTLEGTQYDRRWYGEEFSLIGMNEYFSRRLYNIHFFEVPTVIINKSEIGSATITFGEDPGTTNNRYYVEFYFNPPPLTSESIPLVVNADVWEMALIRGAVGRIEDIRNGQSAKLQQFIKDDVPNYKQSQNISDGQKVPLKCKRRETG